MKTLRRLSAVLAADVVNYSSQMKADENQTLEQLRKLRKDVLDPLVSDHRGNIVKRMGDGWLVEFRSVSDAVLCALDLQSQAPSHCILKLRVGVYLGDIVFEEDDLFGDGVNIASRLQDACEEGAVLVSDVVHRSLDERLSEWFRRAGERQFKNAPEPVVVFHWSSPGSAPPRVTPPNHKKALMIGVLPMNNLSRIPIRNFSRMGSPKRSLRRFRSCPICLSSRETPPLCTRAARLT